MCSSFQYILNNACEIISCREASQVAHTPPDSQEMLDAFWNMRKGFRSHSGGTRSSNPHEKDWVSHAPPPIRKKRIGCHTPEEKDWVGSVGFISVQPSFYRIFPFRPFSLEASWMAPYDHQRPPDLIFHTRLSLFHWKGFVLGQLLGIDSHPWLRTAVRATISPSPWSLMASQSCCILSPS